MEASNGTESSAALKVIDGALALLQLSSSDSAQTLGAVAVDLSHIIKDEEGLKGATEHIFQECLRRSDIHVAGAQLCAYLSTHLILDDSIKTSFRKVFLSRCQSVYSTRNELSESYAKRKELIIFTEFMAQVLIHMRLPNGSIMDPFPEVVVKLLTALLQAVSEESIHCVDRVLQSTGFLLDRNEVQKPALDGLFNNIRDIYLEQVFKPEQQKILLRLILLKTFQWIPNDFLNDM